MLASGYGSLTHPSGISTGCPQLPPSAPSLRGWEDNVQQQTSAYSGGGDSGFLAFGLVQQRTLIPYAAILGSSPAPGGPGCPARAQHQ